jgi:hypothetical protein
MTSLTRLQLLPAFPRIIVGDKVMKFEEHGDTEEREYTQLMMELIKRKKTQKRRIKVLIYILGIGFLLGSVYLSMWIVEVILGVPIISGEQTEGFKGMPTQIGANWGYYIFIFLSIIFVAFSWWILDKIASKIFDKLKLNLYEPPEEF